MRDRDDVGMDYPDEGGLNLSGLFGLPEVGMSFQSKVRMVFNAVLGVAFWGTALSMGWLAVLGLINFHWAAFLAAETLTVFLALSYTGALSR